MIEHNMHVDHVIDHYENLKAMFFNYNTDISQREHELAGVRAAREACYREMEDVDKAVCKMEEEYLKGDKP